jgi:tryptophanyl-tRNA synthetase
MGLDDPTKKMSKSEADPGHAINLLDSPDAIRSKIMRATTDSLREIQFDENRPGINNLLVIYQVLTGRPEDEIEARFAGKGYAALKKELGEVVVEALRPLQSRYREIMAEPRYLETLLAEGAARARPMAEKTLNLAKERVGLG